MEAGNFHFIHTKTWKQLDFHLIHKLKDKEVGNLLQLGFLHQHKDSATGTRTMDQDVVRSCTRPATAADCKHGSYEAMYST